MHNNGFFEKKLSHNKKLIIDPLFLQKYAVNLEILKQRLYNVLLNNSFEFSLVIWLGSSEIGRKKWKKYAGNPKNLAGGL